MYAQLPTPPSWMGHCPHCNGWVAMTRRSCDHCKEAFSQEQVDALKQECAERKHEKKRALYVALYVVGAIVVSVGLFVVIDLQLYRRWF